MYGTRSSPAMGNWPSSAWLFPVTRQRLSAEAACSFFAWLWLLKTPLSGNLYSLFLFLNWSESQHLNSKGDGCVPSCLNRWIGVEIEVCCVKASWCWVCGEEPRASRIRTDWLWVRNDAGSYLPIFLVSFSFPHCHHHVKPSAWPPQMTVQHISRGTLFSELCSAQPE